MSRWIPLACGLELRDVGRRETRWVSQFLCGHAAMFAPEEKLVFDVDHSINHFRGDQLLFARCKAALDLGGDARVRCRGARSAAGYASANPPDELLLLPSLRARSAWRGGVGGGGRFGILIGRRTRGATPHPQPLPTASRREGRKRTGNVEAGRIAIRRLGYQNGG